MSRRSNPRRRCAGLVVTSVIIRRGTRDAGVEGLVKLAYVATGIGPAPNSPSGSQAPRQVTRSVR